MEESELLLSAFQIGEQTILILPHANQEKVDKEQNSQMLTDHPVILQVNVNKQPPAISSVPQSVGELSSVQPAVTTYSANATTSTIPPSEVVIPFSTLEFAKAFHKNSNEKTSTVHVMKTYKEAKDRIQEHEVSTMTKFIVYSTPPKKISFQNEITLSPSAMLHFVDDVPYFYFGKLRLNCHQGFDKGKSTKEKYARTIKEKAQMMEFSKLKQKSSKTKKKNCPASASIIRVYLMPQYKAIAKGISKQWHRTKLATEIKYKLSCGEQIPGEEAFILKLPAASEHRFHVLGKVASVIEPLDARVRHKIEEIVQGGEVRLNTVQALLYDFVSNELNENDRTRQRFYPFKKIISQTIIRTKRNMRASRIDVENVGTMIKNWNLPENTVFFRPFLISNDDLISGVLDEQTSGNRLLKRKSMPKDPVLFVYQNAEMKHLYQRYAGNCVFLDAPYRTLNHAIRLYFLAVKTNIDFQIVAVIITECETTEALYQALEIIRNWNPQISPVCAVVDFARKEIKALENTYPGIKVYICSVHREEAWCRWLKCRENSSVHRKEILANVRNIANAPTEDHLYEEIYNLSSQKYYGDLEAYFEKTWLPEIKRWCAAFKSDDQYLHTNIGTKRLSEELKYHHLETIKTRMLPELIKNLVLKFLPELYIRYIEGNAQIPSLHNSYKNGIPFYLHNRPKWLINHVISKLSAASAEIDTVTVNIRSKNVFEVFSKDIEYEVEISRLEKRVKCCCESYIETRLPCKHVFMVGLKHKNYDMASVSNWLFSNPIFCIDNSYIPAEHPQIESEETLECGEMSFDDYDTQDGEDIPDSAESKLLEIQKKNLITECRSNWKSIQSFFGKLDVDTLSNISQVLTNIVHRLQSKTAKDVLGLSFS